jgi:kynurenine formamidase
MIGQRDISGFGSKNTEQMRSSFRYACAASYGAGITIVEHLCNLEQIARSELSLSAAPVKVREMGTFPVRAYGRFNFQL